MDSSPFLGIELLRFFTAFVSRNITIVFGRKLSPSGGAFWDACCTNVSADNFANGAREMSLFGSRAPRKTAPGYSIIDAQMTIRGEIETDGTVRVEGKIEGTLHRAGTIIVTSEGGVVGDVEAGDITVAGIVHGNLHATGRVEIEPGAEVNGQIRAHSMQLHEGATIHGQVSIGTTPTALPAASPRHLELAGTVPGRARV